jgi:transposase
LMDLPGIGPITAARILADVGDVARFSDRNRFASWTGTAPLDASSGEQIRHRLSRAGNRKVNHMLHMAATTQLRPGEGRAYYQRKRDAQKTHLEAIRCLKRRLSDAIYRQLVHDANRAHAQPEALEPVESIGASPGGQSGASQDPARPTYPPHIGTSDRPLPDPQQRRYAAPTRPRKTTPRKKLQTTG